MYSADKDGREGLLYVQLVEKKGQLYVNGGKEVEVYRWRLILNPFSVNEVEVCKWRLILNPFSLLIIQERQSWSSPLMRHLD